MKISVGLITLAAMTSSVMAIDIGLWRVTRCAGNGYARCTNVGTNQCCIAISGQSDTNGADSALFFGLPNPTRVNGWQRSRNGNNCGAIGLSSATSGGNVCLNANRNTFGTFAGLSYQAGSRKMRRDNTVPKSGRCTVTVEADTFVMENGEEYDLTKMPHALKVQLWNVSGSSNMRTTVVYDTFAAYKKNINTVALPSDVHHI